MFKNFCRRNVAVSDLYDGKCKNKITVAFFSYFPWLHISGSSQVNMEEILIANTCCKKRDMHFHDNDRYFPIMY